MLKQYIVEVKKFIPQNICNKIISYYDRDLFDAKTTGSGADKTVRNCLTKSVIEPKTFGEKIMSQYIKTKVMEAGRIYQQQHSHFDFEIISQCDILKYKANEYKVGYDFHKDMGNNCSHRHLSISINLNNNFLGGEFVFDLPEGQIQFPQNVGDVVMFPSNFMFPHKVKQVLKGTRYALISWIV